MSGGLGKTIGEAIVWKNSRRIASKPKVRSDMKVVGADLGYFFASVVA